MANLITRPTLPVPTEPSESRPRLELLPKVQSARTPLLSPRLSRVPQNSGVWRESPKSGDFGYDVRAGSCPRQIPVARAHILSVAYFDTGACQLRGIDRLEHTHAVAFRVGERNVLPRTGYLQRFAEHFASRIHDPPDGVLDIRRHQQDSDREMRSGFTHTVLI